MYVCESTTHHLGAHLIHPIHYVNYFNAVIMLCHMSSLNHVRSIELDGSSFVNLSIMTDIICYIYTVNIYTLLSSAELTSVFISTVVKFISLVVNSDGNSATLFNLIWMNTCGCLIYQSIISDGNLAIVLLCNLLKLRWNGYMYA